MVRCVTHATDGLAAGEGCNIALLQDIEQNPENFHLKDPRINILCSGYIDGSFIVWDATTCLPLAFINARQLGTILPCMYMKISVDDSGYATCGNGTDEMKNDGSDPSDPTTQLKAIVAKIKGLGNGNEVIHNNNNNNNNGSTSGESVSWGKIGVEDDASTNHNHNHNHMPFAPPRQNNTGTGTGIMSKVKWEDDIGQGTERRREAIVNGGDEPALSSSPLNSPRPTGGYNRGAPAATSANLIQADDIAKLLSAGIGSSAGGASARMESSIDTIVDCAVGLYEPNGAVVIGACSDRYFKLWECDTGRLLFSSSYIHSKDKVQKNSNSNTNTNSNTNSNSHKSKYKGNRTLESTLAGLNMNTRENEEQILTLKIKYNNLTCTYILAAGYDSGFIRIWNLDQTLFLTLREQLDYQEALANYQEDSESDDDVESSESSSSDSSDDDSESESNSDDDYSNSNSGTGTGTCSYDGTNSVSDNGSGNDDDSESTNKRKKIEKKNLKLKRKQKNVIDSLTVKLKSQQDNDRVDREAKLEIHKGGDGSVARGTSKNDITRNKVGNITALSRFAMKPKSTEKGDMPRPKSTDSASNNKKRK